MFVVKADRVDNGYVVQGSGHTVDGAQSTRVCATAEELRDLIKQRADEWYAADQARAALEAGQVEVASAAQRYNAARAGGATKEAALRVALELEA